MRRCLLCVTTLAAALTIACGAVPASSRPSIAPTFQRVVLHEQDAGRSIVLHHGDQVELALAEPRPVPGTSLTWDAASSAPAVMKMTASDHRGPATDSSYVADFTAQDAGSAQLVAQGVRRCEAMLPSSCQQPRLTFPVVVQ